MLLDEFDNAEELSQEKLLALAQFLLGRADDTTAQKKISMTSFIKLAHSLGISITPDQLINLASNPPLNNVIKNIEGDQVVFKGAEGDPETMDTSKAEKIVAQMAKRAAK